MLDNIPRMKSTPYRWRKLEPYGDRDTVLTDMVTMQTETWETQLPPKAQQALFYRHG